MNEILYSEIPSLDLSDFTSGDPVRKAKFVADLGAAYNAIGFVAIRNHYLTEELSTKLYDTFQKFFYSADELKKKYEFPELHGQRGYIGKGKETAKGFKTPDLKEFYHIGQHVTDNDPVKNEYPANVWPAEFPELEEIGLTVYKQLEKTGIAMLQAIALYLGLDEHYFDDKVKNGNSILRSIHYFPIENPDEVPADAVRAAAHGDINLITLLMGASAEGLQVLRRDGAWIPITALPEQLIVNVGDMLDRLTNNKLKSTIHRVVNPPKEKMKTSRFSMPFFMHPRSEMDLTCLPSCIDEAHPKLFADMTAGEFLNERLIELGLKKK
ncbi:2-oxoglutarate and iron-dependent oxygenase domain-containing protein [Cytophagaceae bacterium DM2B3-1]|uniref:2-oxoglutarate and iron-dependent oxygenase domain-containing protein n=1 Tax=Xanthocytophaga flava TaxID=3048013 RepID=A0ABT7CXC8_9BACT|nr:2-oxoglutarate and iron-dependent oxygenase domain-containing protein [Xanthocytophaga flavus]MDJ1498156.1 2-oxoglutarate and iron-dependent oxygenase domain-containing protein [Xanthocytophaga flavus]